jgi:hypothetical protein
MTDGRTALRDDLEGRSPLRAVTAIKRRVRGQAVQDDLGAPNVAPPTLEER